MSSEAAPSRLFKHDEELHALNFSIDKYDNDGYKKPVHSWDKSRGHVWKRDYNKLMNERKKFARKVEQYIPWTWCTSIVDFVKKYNMGKWTNGAVLWRYKIRSIPLLKGNKIVDNALKERSHRWNMGPTFTQVETIKKYHNPHGKIENIAKRRVYPFLYRQFFWNNWILNGKKVVMDNRLISFVKNTPENFFFLADEVAKMKGGLAAVTRIRKYPRRKKVLKDMLKLEKSSERKDVKQSHTAMRAYMKDSLWWDLERKSDLPDILLDSQYEPVINKIVSGLTMRISEKLRGDHGLPRGSPTDRNTSYFKKKLIKLGNHPNVMVRKSLLLFGFGDEIYQRWRWHNKENVIAGRTVKGNAFVVDLTRQSCKALKMMNTDDLDISLYKEQKEFWCNAK